MSQSKSSFIATWTNSGKTGAIGDVVISRRHTRNGYELRNTYYLVTEDYSRKVISAKGSRLGPWSFPGEILYYHGGRFGALARLRKGSQLYNSCMKAYEKLPKENLHGN